MTDTAPIFGIRRHCLATDGKGVTTLVTLYGCPLRCRYCLNPQSFHTETKVRHFTPQTLYDTVKVDHLYFLATGGGVTFGGGEPLLYPSFLHGFRSICGPDWHLCAETSLNVSQDSVRQAAEVIDHFYVDVKDMDPSIYARYTGKSNAVVYENLRLLIERVTPARITVRLPLIPDHNTEADREKSHTLLALWGITDFDRFSYIIK